MMSNGGHNKANPEFKNGISSYGSLISGKEILESRIVKQHNGAIVSDMRGDPRVDELLEKVKLAKAEIKEKYKNEKIPDKHFVDNEIAKRCVQIVHEIFGKYDPATEGIDKIISSSRERLVALEQKIADEKDLDVAKEFQSEIDCLKYDIDQKEKESNQIYAERSGDGSTLLKDYPNGRLVCREYAAVTALAIQSAGINCRFVNGFTNDEYEADRSSGVHSFVFLNDSADIIEATDAKDPLRYNINYASIARGETIIASDVLGKRFSSYGTGRISDSNKFIEITPENETEIKKQIEEYDAALMDKFYYKKTDYIQKMENYLVKEYKNLPEMQKVVTLEKLKADFAQAKEALEKEQERMEKKTVTLQSEGAANMFKKYCFNAIVDKVVTENYEELADKAGDDIVSSEESLPEYEKGKRPIMKPEDLEQAKAKYNEIYKTVSEEVFNMCRDELNKHAPDKVTEIESKFNGDVRRVGIVYAALEGEYIDAKTRHALEQKIEKKVDAEIESPQAKELQKEILEKMREVVKPQEKTTSMNKDVQEQVARLAMSDVKMKTSDSPTVAAIPNGISGNRVMEI
jgi:predicted HNH restriction endonuclease